jgi:IMP dehydrogenase/GMP reductase
MSRAPASRASRYSGNVSHVQGSPSVITTPGMSSTPAITSTSTSWSSARHGAKPTPQLPITTVVTPFADDGVNRSDQMAWPS